MSHVRDFWESEGLRKILLAALVVYVLVASTVIIAQQYQQRQYTQNAHANTVALLEEHTATLKAVAKLQTEVAEAFAKGVPALTKGQSELVAKLSWIECTLATPHGTDCGAEP